MTATAEQVTDDIAFRKPGTPCEQAWADLCDQTYSERAEAVIAWLGGWEVMIVTPITFREFTAAYAATETPEEGACSPWRAAMVAAFADVMEVKG